MKRALIIRHVPYEGVAGYRLPIEAAGYEISRIDVTDPAFAELDFVAPDLLVMMGGPMGAYETERYPWIAHEVERLADRLEAGAPTLGVCLGAQIMAAALGARVYPGTESEIGFGKIALSDAGAASTLRHLDDVPVLHWHGDTFDRPENVELLASTNLYEQQGFSRGRNILALQFHAEMGLDPRFGAWLDYLDCPQRRAGLQADHDRLGEGAVAAGRAMITEWLAGLDR